MSALPQPFATTVVRVLWVDDEPAAIEIYRRLLHKEQDRLGIEIKIVNSIEDARKELETGEYAAVVVDCKMNPYDDSVNGAEFLLDINKTHKDLPTFVYSAFLDDPLYQGLLNKSYAILTVSKLDEFEKPLSKDAFFRLLSKTASQYSAVKDLYPEKIQFSDYIKHPERYSAEFDAHWDKHGHWIKTEMKKKKLAWCVVCGEQIERSSHNPFDFPNEKTLKEIGNDTNLIPFAYSDTLAPEDSIPLTTDGSHWAPTSFSEDYYPRLKIRLENVVLEDDFDTGAIRTHVSDALIRRGFLEPWRDSDLGHLGKPYRFFSKTIPVAILGPLGTEQKREVAITVVQNWDHSPFVLVNKKRKCLLGRDLLHAFPVEILLDSRSRTTHVRLSEE